MAFVLNCQSSRLLAFLCLRFCFSYLLVFWWLGHNFALLNWCSMLLNTKLPVCQPTALKRELPLGCSEGNWWCGATCFWAQGCTAWTWLPIFVLVLELILLNLTSQLICVKLCSGPTIGRVGHVCWVPTNSQSTCGGSACPSGNQMYCVHVEWSSTTLQVLLNP